MNYKSASLLTPCCAPSRSGKAATWPRLTKASWKIPGGASLYSDCLAGGEDIKKNQKFELIGPAFMAGPLTAIGRTESTGKSRQCPHFLNSLRVAPGGSPSFCKRGRVCISYRRLPSLPYRGFPNPPTVRPPGAPAPRPGPPIGETAIHPVGKPEVRPHKMPTKCRSRRRSPPRCERAITAVGVIEFPAKPPGPSNFFV